MEFDPSTSFQQSPLPVNLIFFNGKQIEEKIILTWKTVKEKAISHFEIQKSKDSKEFASFGNVNGINSSIYNFSDSNPIKGVNYYRLKMIDGDGTYKMSNIIAVKFAEDNSFVNTTNPVINNEIMIKTDLFEPDFKLVNSLGQFLEIKIFKTIQNEYFIKAIDPLIGIYYLNVISNNKIITKKLLFLSN